ncbi:MAG: class I SAM-dependent methyltransferase [Thermoplasmata archaeon]
MPWKYSDDYYREYTRTSWNAVAKTYLAFMDRLKPAHRELIRRLRPKKGERILDLGAGPGEPAMTIARIVGERGRVMGLDLSQKMVTLARSSARAEGVDNVEFRVMDCEHLELPAASFDAVVSAFGFQIFTHPEKAAHETLRVLKPGGRVAACIWSTGDRVPYLDAIIGPMLAHAEPDETGYLPTPFEIGGEGEMVEFLGEAGFRNATEARVTHNFRFRDPEEYFDVTLRGTPIGHSLSEEKSAVQREVLAATRSNLLPWTRSDGITLPGECVFVTARK